MARSHLVTCVVERVFEGKLGQSIGTFLNHNDLIDASQHGNSTNDNTKMKGLDSATEHKFADAEKRLRLSKEEDQRTLMQENIDKMQL